MCVTVIMIDRSTDEVAEFVQHDPGPIGLLMDHAAGVGLEEVTLDIDHLHAFAARAQREGLGVEELAFLGSSSLAQGYKVSQHKVAATDRSSQILEALGEPVDQAIEVTFTDFVLADKPAFDKTPCRKGLNALAGWRWPA